MIDSFRGEKYRFLSSFWPVRIQYDGVMYASVEHAYQAAKTLVPSERLEIRQAPTPGKAKRLGQQVTLRPDWEEVKVPIMTALVSQKFNPRYHPSLAERLLATEDQELVEGNTWGDKFWGVCDGEGKNFLGRILMAVRSEIRQ